MKARRLENVDCSSCRSGKEKVVKRIWPKGDARAIDISFGTLKEPALECRIRKCWQSASLRNPSNRSLKPKFNRVESLWLKMSLQSGAGANLFLYSTILVGFLCLNGRFRAAGFVIAALGSDLLICQLLKDLFIRRRPTVVPPLTHFDCKSFPSGHSMGFALAQVSQFRSKNEKMKDFCL